MTPFCCTMTRANHKCKIGKKNDKINCYALVKFGVGTSVNCAFRHFNGTTLDCTHLGGFGRKLVLIENFSQSRLIMNEFGNGEK